MTKLSIIIVTYNASFDLERTLNSLFTQSFCDYEVILIDGESTDNTLSIIKQNEDKIRFWVSEPDEGIYDAMNKGIKFSKGEYLQFLNAGDYFIDGGVLERIFEDTCDTPTLIYGDINILRTDGTELELVALPFTKSNLLAQGTRVACHQAMFVHRESAPFYNLAYKFKAELNWYFDIVELNNFRSLKKDTAVVNYALGGWGHQNFLKNRLDWLRLVFDRYGFMAIWRNNLLPFIWEESLRRHPKLEKMQRSLLWLPNAIKRIFHNLWSRAKRFVSHS